MRLTLISVVAAFLVYSAIAERNGPTNVRAPRRRSNETGGRIVNIRHESLSNSKRRPNIFKLTTVLRTPRNPQRKFSGMMTPKNPLVARSHRSDVRVPGKSSLPKSYQKRRSLDLGMANHQSVSEVEEDAIYLEPMHQENWKADLLGKDFAPDSNHELGPAIGPLEFPGIGKNVYIRLMVAPDKETTSHVTLHLVNKAPVESFSDVHGSVDFVLPHKPGPLFTGEKSIAMAPIPPKPSISSMNLRRNRFGDNSFHRFGFNPSKLQAVGLFRVQNQLKTPQAMASHRPVQFGDPRQYLAAPNHHRLPIVLRPVDNLIDLPIYPPLSENGLRNGIESNQNRANVSSQSQMDMEIAGDTQQSASSRHTSVSRNDVNRQSAWRPVGVLVLPEPEVTSNSRESPQPVFMEEVTAPDLSSGNISAKSPWRKLENSSTSADAHRDKHVVSADLDYPSRHTTTSRTDYLFRRDAWSGAEHKTDNPEGGLRSTTSHPSPTETTGRSLLGKKKD